MFKLIVIKLADIKLPQFVNMHISVKVVVGLFRSWGSFYPTFHVIPTGALYVM